MRANTTDPTLFTPNRDLYANTPGRDNATEKNNIKLNKTVRKSTRFRRSARLVLFRFDFLWGKQWGWRKIAQSSTRAVLSVFVWVYLWFYGARVRKRMLRLCEDTSFLLNFGSFENGRWRLNLPKANEFVFICPCKDESSFIDLYVYRLTSAVLKCVY